jgi:hypothetical protein
VDNHDNIYIATKHGSFRVEKSSFGLKTLRFGAENKNDSTHYKVVEIDDKLLPLYLFGPAALLWDDSLNLSLNIKGQERTLRIPGRTLHYIKRFKKFGDEIYFSEQNRLSRIGADGRLHFLYFPNYINNFTRDDRGHIWVGCMNDGVFELSEEDSILSHHLEKTTVNDLLFDHRGELWLTTAGHGLFHCPDLQNTYFKPGDPLGQPISFLKLLDNKLIVASMNGDFFSIDSLGKIVALRKKQSKDPPVDIIRFQGGYLIGFHLRSERLSFSGHLTEMFFPSGVPLGIYQAQALDGDTFVFTQRRSVMRFVKTRLLDSATIYKKVFDLKKWNNRLLLCADDGVYEVQGISLKQPAYLAKSKGFSFRHSEYDPQGNLWFTTTENGLFVLRKSGLFEAFSGRTKLPSDIVYRLRFSAAGEAFLCTNKGLYMTKSLDSGDVPWRYIYTEAKDALPFHGKLYALVRGELVILNIQPEKADIPFHFDLTSISRDSTEINRRELSAVHPGFSSLNFSFDYAFSKQQPPLSYTLTGPLTETVTNSSYELKFRNLPPGQYTLTASVVSGNNTTLTQVIPFRILPAFTQTIYFKVAVSLLLMGLIILVTSLILRRRRKLEDQKNEARRMILEYQLVALKAQINPHFMSNCLASIQNLIVGNKIIQATKYISKFGLLVRKILDFSVKSWVTLEEELEVASLYLELEKLRFDHKFTFIIVMDNESELKSSYVPALILNPLLENAVWHGVSALENNEKGLIEIGIRESNDRLAISIMDNGPGIVLGKEAPTSRESKGIRLVQERLKNINFLYHSDLCELSFRSPVKPGGRGTEAVVTLPANLNPF